MVTYSALSICHFSLPLCMPLPVFLAIVKWNTHGITFSHQPIHPVDWSLYSGLSDCSRIPSHGRRPVDWTHGWILLFLYGLQPSIEGGSVWKRGKDPPAFWHVFSSPTFLQGWQAYCTLPLCRGNFALLEESGKLEKENWDRNRKYDRGKGAAKRQRTLEINIKCGSLLLQKLSCKRKNTDSPESTVSSKRQI